MDKPALWDQIQDVAQLSGNFLLRSGLESNTYFDKYQFECRPDLIKEVSQHMLKLLPSNTDVLAGLELGGIPLAIVLSIETGLPCVFVRKVAKQYGTRRIVEGPDVAGKRVCIVEDIVTTGGQIMMSAREIRKLGATVDHALCAIWRRSTADNPLASENIVLHSVFSPKIQMGTSQLQSN